jgi:hypothetical protein
MASVNVTSAYVGNVVETLLELMVLGNQAVQKGSVHIETDVKKALYLPRITADADQIQARAETPSSPSDSFTYEERLLTPTDQMFYDLVNPRYFEDVWRPFQPTGPLVDRVDNPQVLSAILRETVKTIGNQLGKLIWQGDTAGAAAVSWMDGYEKIIAADAASIKVTPGGVITAANVIGILESVEAAIPESIWEDPAVVFHMSTADLRLYKEAARALDFKGSNITEALEARFAGREIRHYAGLSKDKIIVAKATTGRDSNLWAGVDVSGDEENVKVERYRPESEKFIIKVLYKYGVQVAQPEESIIYLPA